MFPSSEKQVEDAATHRGVFWAQSTSKNFAKKLHHRWVRLGSKYVYDTKWLIISLSFPIYYLFTFSFSKQCYPYMILPLLLTTQPLHYQVINPSSPVPTQQPKLQKQPQIYVKFRKIYRNRPAVECLFKYKIAKNCALSRVFPCEFCATFRNK